MLYAGRKNFSFTRLGVGLKFEQQFRRDIVTFANNEDFEVYDRVVALQESSGERLPGENLRLWEPEPTTKQEERIKLSPTILIQTAEKEAC